MTGLHWSSGRAEYICIFHLETVQAGVCRFFPAACMYRVHCPQHIYTDNVTMLHVINLYIRVFFTRAYIHIHAYIHTYIHTYLFTYLPTYLLTYIHTYIHTYCMHACICGGQ